MFLLCLAFLICHICEMHVVIDGTFSLLMGAPLCEPTTVYLSILQLIGI